MSYWQTAEWGNCGLQGAFGQLCLPLPIQNSDQHSNLLEIIVRLQNLRTRKVGFNQIQTVYMPIWKAGDQERIWNEFESMMFGELRNNDHVTQYHIEVVHAE